VETVVLVEKRLTVSNDVLKLPWYYDNDRRVWPEKDRWQNVGDYRALLPPDDGDEIGEFIVKACNSYQVILEALDRIVHHAYDDDTPLEDILADFDDMRSIASQALDKAGEVNDPVGSNYVGG